MVVVRGQEGMEYLTSKRLADAKDTISRFHVSMTPAHTIVAQACLGVLLHVDENITEANMEKFPLAEYAAQQWVGHARFEGVSPNIQDGMKHLFDPDNDHLVVWVWIYDPESTRSHRETFERPSRARATPLHYAAFCGLHDIVKFLVVESLQDVNAWGFDSCETPLLVASREGHSQVARVLLEHGANVESRNESGPDWSPLERATKNGHVEVIKVLLEHGADVMTLETNGETPLHLALAYGQPAAARVLLEHGADVNAKSPRGRTPLYYAIFDGVASVPVLLEYGANTNSKSSDNMTPLHQVLEWGSTEIATREGCKC
jgi:ankyrin repeat protein